jgi:hypothetical protein
MAAEIKRDPDLEWLDHVQPVGLVVAPVLLKDLNLPPTRQTQVDSAQVAEHIDQDDSKPALRDPWTVERLIGSIRRECLDHMIVFGEAHLRRILGAYAAYYNESRTHRSLNKDAPFHRGIERLGAITSHPILGGLHHQYCRIKFSVHTGAHRP